MVDIALGDHGPVCVAGDVSGDGHITVEEIVAALNRALGGCAGG